jgi:ATP-binding cassette subfamily B protein
MKSENIKKRDISPKLIWAFFGYMRRTGAVIWNDRKRLILSFYGVYLLAATMPFLQSGANAWLLNALTRKGGTTEKAVLGFVLLIGTIALARTMLGRLQDYTSRKMWFALEERLEVMELEKRGSLDIASHEDSKNQNTLNTIRENGSWRVRNFFDRMAFLSQNIIEVLIASVVLAYASWWVFLLIIVATLPQLIIEIFYGREVWGIDQGKAEVKRRWWNLKWHFQHTELLTEVKLFQNIPHFLGLIRDLFRRFRREEELNEDKRLKRYLWSQIGGQIVLLVATGFFALKVFDGAILIGTFTFYLAAMGDFRQSLGSLFYNLGRQYEDGLFVKDFFEFLDIPISIASPKEAIILDPKETPEIRFDHVTFSYPGKTEPVLKDFTAVIHPGEKVALVGVNGAGKTTLIKLLCRFYDPTEGKITVNGRDLKTIDLESWYHTLGILFQDYGHYHMIVRDAIAVGRTTEAQKIEKVKEAARASEADAFIESWEKDYDQMLGKQFDEGLEPSIGQWQKLALARTFYRDPRILILDEPTSSIDAEAEAKIFEKLDKLPKDRSVILISHRFSTVRSADTIFVIESGRIKESGSHEALLKKKGIYAKLFHLQAKGYQ